jgi:hypothetical protein
VIEFLGSKNVVVGEQRGTDAELKRVTFLWKNLKRRDCFAEICVQVMIQA